MYLLCIANRHPYFDLADQRVAASLLLSKWSISCRPTKGTFTT
jgi:hypothetical protein